MTFHSTSQLHLPPDSTLYGTHSLYGIQHGLGCQSPLSVSSDNTSVVRCAGSSDQAEALADYAVAELTRIDLWVNNAGASQPTKGDLLDSDPAIMRASHRSATILPGMLNQGALLSCKWHTA